jgi:hypothetical protein
MSTGSTTPVVSKPWFLSKTVWVNLISTTLGVMAYLSGGSFISGNPGLVAALVAAQGVLNVILRLVTAVPVS